MITRRIAAGLIGAGIVLSGTAYATQPNPEHKVTICHSGNGKNFSAIKVDYEGALGHAKTDEDDIIPAFPGFPGQNLTDDGLYRLEHSCNGETTTTTQSTPTSTESPTTSTAPSTPAPTTTTTTLPDTTTTSSTVPVQSTSTSTLPPATTTTTTAAPSSTVTTLVTPSTVTVPPSSTTTITSTTLGTIPSTSLAAPTSSTVTSESLPVTGSEPIGLVWGGLVLLALGIILVIVSR